MSLVQTAIDSTRWLKNSKNQMELEKLINILSAG